MVFLFKYQRLPKIGFKANLSTQSRKSQFGIKEKFSYVFRFFIKEEKKPQVGEKNPETEKKHQKPQNIIKPMAS